MRSDIVIKVEGGSYAQPHRERWMEILFSTRMLGGFQIVFVFSSLFFNSYLLLNHYRSHGKTKGAADPIVIIASQAAGAIVGERE